jgi:thiamine pyrophosphate-dependent acetolactate synthase large subunit-like protein
MPRPRTVDGGELVARTLKQFGVEVAFGLHGGHLDSLLVGLHRNGIRLIDTRHEAVAVNAADGYARATGRLGVAFATAASGYSNAIAGLVVHAHLFGHVVPRSGAAAAPLALRDSASEAS